MLRGWVVVVVVCVDERMVGDCCETVAPWSAHLWHIASLVWRHQVLITMISVHCSHCTAYVLRTLAQRNLIVAGVTQLPAQIVQRLQEIHAAVNQNTWEPWTHAGDLNKLRDINISLIVGACKMWMLELWLTYVQK